MLRGLRRRLHALFHLLKSEHTSPWRLGAAVLVGCMVGCTPLFGFHLPICIALAWLLGLNKLVVYAAANLSIPPLVPFLGFGAVELGERLVYGHFLTLTPNDFVWSNARALAHRFFAAWMLGGLVLGGAIGVLGGSGVLLLARARRRKMDVEDPVSRAIERARRLYGGLPGRFKWYARVKYVLDPCYRRIAPLIEPGTFTVDLGTGLGMLPVLLGILGDGRRALGIEWDSAKVACGRHAARDFSQIEVIEGDVREVVIPPCDAITLVDMLHYYDAGTQRAILARCQAALRPGGRLLIREGDRTRRGGARFTRGIEKLVTRLGWNRGPAVRFRPVEALRQDLEALGFSVQVDEAAGQLHPGNVLLVAEVQQQRIATSG
jgi:uncharacterized protein (DUF2062 family)/2-polyprenyl-3-methyl-5-hydroxy-6-metoxy-1,4-benzoquinol methylase